MATDVEGEVELGGEIERHALGPLGLHHALVLAEDRALEGLDHLVGLREVVVARDQDSSRRSARR
jgi:hypothetical protein